MEKQLFLVFLLILSPAHLFAEDVKDFDEQRAKEVKKWSAIGFGNVNETLKSAQEALENENASLNELKDAAKRANAAANYVGYIEEEYSDYMRDNYKYDFVLEKVSPAHDSYVEKSNALKAVRNDIYMRIGDILKTQGKITEAFFYYRDAYRLSIFNSFNKGTRYKAEQEMKKMLGLQEIESFITWKQ